MTQPEGEPVTLNLNDPLVREMAQRNHVPRETWTLGGTLVSVSCDMCGYEWPCPTRLLLREWDEAAAMSQVDTTRWLTR